MDEHLFQQAVNELEALDRQFRSEGIPDEYRDKWQVNVNVGLWIVGRQTAEFLNDVVRRERPQVILELGTSVGYSALWLGRAAAVYGGQVYTMDREHFKIKEAQGYLDRVGLSERVTCLTGEILELLPTWNRPLDLVFIDAGKREYLAYLMHLESYLNPGALVIADNVDDFADKMEAYRVYVETDSRYETTHHEMDHGVLVSRWNGEN